MMAATSTGNPTIAGHHAVDVGLSALRGQLVPLGSFVVGISTHLLLLAHLLRDGQWHGLNGALTAWDGDRYLQIAQHGYPPGLTDLKAGNNLAFMPLYPGLIRLTHEVTQLSYPVAAIVVANVALLVIAVLTHELLCGFLTAREAVIGTVLVVAAQPMSLVFSMGYSEAPFTALALGALLALRTDRWLIAGACAGLAGLTRPTGIAITMTIIIAAVVEVWRRRELRGRVVLGSLIACVGTPAYLLWVAVRCHSLTAWFTIQRVGWGTHWDNGHLTWRFLTWVWSGTGDWVMITAALITITSAVMLTLSVRITWWPILIYALLILVMTCGQSNYESCKPRMVLPAAIALSVPIARSLARSRTSSVIIAVCCLITLSSWYGAYMLTTWRYGI